MSYLYQCDNCYEIVQTNELLTSSESWHCERKGRLIYGGTSSLENVVKNIIEAGNELLGDLPDPTNDNIKWLSSWIKYAEEMSKKFGMR